MNLKKIADKLDEIIQFPKEKLDYDKTAQKFPKNFYVQLAKRLKSALSTKQSFNENYQVESSILGNQVRVIRYPKNRGNKLVVTINGQTASNIPLGFNTLVETILNCVTSEIEGRVKVNRPDNRRLANDRMEISEESLRKNGVKFPSSVYDRMTISTTTGKKQNAVKNDFKGKPVLSSEDYNYGVQEGLIDPEDYEKLGSKYIKVTSKDVFFVDYKEGLTPLNLDEFLARCGDDKLAHYAQNHRRTIIVYNDKVYEVINTGTETKVKITR